MKDKFTVSLVWHNCKTHPPKEDWNDNLYVTDGVYGTAVSYESPDVWFDKSVDERIPKRDLLEYWWADIHQTMRSSVELMDARNKMIRRNENV